MCPDVKKYISIYEKFATVVLLDELCCLSNAAIMKFNLESCYRADAIKFIILSRTGDRFDVANSDIQHIEVSH